MIKKLRRKFILVIMSVVTVLIAAAFLAVLTATSRSLSRDAEFALQQALQKTGYSAGGQGFGPEMRRLPTITVVLDASGAIVTISDHFYNVTLSEIESITALALDSGALAGQLREYSLRFQVEAGVEQTVIAFVDTSMEKAVIAGLLANFALIGGATLLLFFGVSILLSRWVVRPVEKAWNSQRQFIADASHELKTPLTVVLSNVEMLASDSTLQDDRARTRLDNILEEARRMRSLVNDLLSLARTDSVSSGRTLDTIDLSALVRGALLIFEPVFFDAGMRLEDHVDEGLLVRGDGARLRQLAEILLDNAAKYTLPAGLVTVRLTAAGKSDIVLEVANESELIPKEELEHIFERFYRLDKARSGGGYGLGLAIAASIVREHSGIISVKSENNTTTFTVTLPGVR